jgi:hypothetical protein
LRASLACDEAAFSALSDLSWSSFSWKGLLDFVDRKIGHAGCEAAAGLRQISASRLQSRSFRE